MAFSTLLMGGMQRTARGSSDVRFAGIDGEEAEAPTRKILCDQNIGPGRMTWVSPDLEERKGACVCGCETYGLKRKRPEGHVRGCPCPRCRGGRNRAKGDSKARKARRLMGLVGPNTRHEEHLRGPVLTESKAGKQVQPVWTRFQSARAQAEASRAVGDHRPFVFLAHPDDTSEFVICVSSRDWENVLAAYESGDE